MKMLFVTALFALTALAAAQSAHAQLFTGNTSVLINKICVDGCFIGAPPDTQP